MAYQRKARYLMFCAGGFKEKLQQRARQVGVTLISLADLLYPRKA